MNREDFSPEVLHELVFYREEQALFDLLDHHPGLDEYVVPVLALMQVLNALLFVDRSTEENRGSPVVELGTLPDGKVVARVDDGNERGIEHYVPVILSIAQQSASQFLNEKGDRLLGVLAAGQQDRALQAKLQRYQKALRRCLDQGHNDEWIWQKAEEEERARGLDKSYDQTLAESFRMKNLMMVQVPEELKSLVEESPWMQVYVTGMPIEFAANHRELRSALGRFCWGGSWVEERRAIKSDPQIMTPLAWQMLGRISELALEHRAEAPVHSQIASRIRGQIKILKRCEAEGADQVLFERASLYVA